MAKSIEEQVEDWCKNQLEEYFTKTESINSEIDEALKKAPSKKGGSGQNLPDIKCFVSVGFKHIPVMIECKGTKGDFVKTDENGLVTNMDKKGNTDYAAIAKKAVNGAIHYAKSILDFTATYKEAIAIGVNGYKQNNDLEIEIGVYYLSKENLGIPKEVDKFSDLSFLRKKNLKEFFKKVEELKLTQEELENRKLVLEDEIESKLKRLNQTMHDDLDIAVKSRVMLIAGLIMAGLGVENISDGLKIEELKGESGKNSNDGKKIIDKIADFLRAKELPEEKQEVIMNDLSNVFNNKDLYAPKNGESKLKKVYTIVYRDILPYLSSNLHNIDFTGKLFNVLNEWVDVPDGDKNDVVLTPRYVTELMARLTEVNKDSYVWDYATGSAGFLISAMHLMINDAKQKVKSPDKLDKTIREIKAEHLLGIEKLPEIYILAVLNMILMGDGSSNIIHGNSLTQFDGKYQQGEKRDKKFPANVFLLNPPYSAPGKGMVFVEKALSRMSGGKAAVLIQENAGSSQGDGYTKRILEHNTLVASIHMTTDLFIGKSSVQTAIYVFDVGIPHDTEKLVKFIDFSNDGYERQNRKKSSQSVNLKDVNNAKDRYDELVNLVTRGKGKNDKNLNYYKDCYVEDYISLEGNDWTYSQHQEIDIKPTEDDFKKVVKEYMAWQISDLIKNGEQPEKTALPHSKISGNEGGFKEFKIGDLFEKLQLGMTKKKFNKAEDVSKERTQIFNLPLVNAKHGNNGIMYYGKNSDFESAEMTIDIVNDGAIATGDVYPQPQKTGVLYNAYLIKLKNQKFIDKKCLFYFASAIQKSIKMKYGYDNKAGWEKVKNEKISLPTTVDGIIDFTYMEEYINNIGKLVAQKVVYWLEQQQINNNILEIERTLPKGALPMVAEKGFRH